MKYLLALMLLHAQASIGQSSLADSLIQKSSLQETLLFLSADSLRGRLTGSEGATNAAKFIATKFDSAGLEPFPGNDGYFDNYIARYEGKKIPAINVVGAIPGKSANDTIIIFSAHYDHIGQKDDLPTNKEYNYNDEIFNGANDNATGVAALLELAKYYKAQDSNRYLVLFVAFSGEEMGMLGSYHLTKKLDRRIVKSVINLEMLGRPAADNCFIVSFNNNKIANVLNRYLRRYQPVGAKNFFINDPYLDEDLAHRSDHYSFTRKTTSSFTIMGSSPTDAFYHTVDDEYGTIDFDFLLKATKNIALACEQFIK